MLHYCTYLSYCHHVTLLYIFKLLSSCYIIVHIQVIVIMLDYCTYLRYCHHVTLLYIFKLLSSCYIIVHSKLFSTTFIYVWKIVAMLSLFKWKTYRLSFSLSKFFKVYRYSSYLSYSHHVIVLYIFKLLSSCSIIVIVLDYCNSVLLLWWCYPVVGFK